MAILRDILSLICRCASEGGGRFDDDLMLQIEKQIRQEWGGERIYISPPGSRKDPARGEAIRKAAARLPTGVVCERLGVSRQTVSYHMKKRRP